MYFNLLPVSFEFTPPYIYTHLSPAESFILTIGWPWAEGQTCVNTRSLFCLKHHCNVNWSPSPVVWCNKYQYLPRVFLVCLVSFGNNRTSFWGAASPRPGTVNPVLLNRCCVYTATETITTLHIQFIKRHHPTEPCSLLNKISVWFYSSNAFVRTWLPSSWFDQQNGCWQTDQGYNTKPAFLQLLKYFL